MMSILGSLEADTSGGRSESAGPLGAYRTLNAGPLGAGFAGFSAAADGGNRLGDAAEAR